MAYAAVGAVTLLGLDRLDEEPLAVPWTFTRNAWYVVCVREREKCFISLQLFPQFFLVLFVIISS